MHADAHFDGGHVSPGLDQEPSIAGHTCVWTNGLLQSECVRVLVGQSHRPMDLGQSSCALVNEVSQLSDVFVPQPVVILAHRVAVAAHVVQGVLPEGVGLVCSRDHAVGWLVWRPVGGPAH